MAREMRKIIRIDEEKCDGCGLCATACHEGAIEIVDGKAKLIREHFCDGLGDCLPSCPVGAITFEEREAESYDEAAVLAHQGRAETVAPAGSVPSHGHAAGAMGISTEQAQAGAPHRGRHVHHGHGGCPGSRVRMMAGGAVTAAGASAPVSSAAPVSRLMQWPVQIKLVPTRAPFFDGAKLLIAADCTTFAYANMHEEFMRGHVTLIGCPKLDNVDYTDKLTEIIAGNDIRSITIVRMEVPCCGGIQVAAQNALRASGKFIPWQVVTISTDGRKLD